MTATVTDICTDATTLTDDPLFDASPELAHIRDYARARRVSPWAMLGATLARLCATIPPTVVLPPLVGSYGSLNLFVGIIGASGIGKGAAERASRDGVQLGESEPFTSSVGSGEGILHLFTRYDKDAENGVDQFQDRALLSVPEVDALTALSGRQGATLLPTLRSVFSGEQLSPAYANREKALRLEDHSYRVAMLVGIQPGRAGALLDDSDGGTPQRFLWLPAVDPALPDIPPPEPAPLLIYPQAWPAERIVLSVDERTKHRILADRADVLRGNKESSHLLLVQEKVAALLTVLQDRRAITRDDWVLAGRVMAVSKHTRQETVDYLKSRATTTSRERGRLDGERRAAADESAADAAMRRVCQWITAKLEDSHDGMTAGALRKVAASRDRDLIDPALAVLAKVGNVTCDGDPERGTYRVGDRRG